ncbi:hypothetical protein DPF_1554 [Desulfoplanes formicivorans]|uniref:Uncharacterized protein n=1 Tax=Desulfoplanes formicivorans TaxID=1592317 RepID=A0A194AFI7_9BACT|nr:hypothetical protein DPF_1554 [Desulfoplanes formicivorans]
MSAQWEPKEWERDLTWIMIGRHTLKEKQTQVPENMVFESLQPSTYSKVRWEAMQQEREGRGNKATQQAGEGTNHHGQGLPMPAVARIHRGFLFLDLILSSTL